MSNSKDLRLLKRGIKEWNEWREVNRNFCPDLRNAKLDNANLRCANLIRASLNNACLSRADLCDANLSLANLLYADLSDANLSRADMSNTGLINANMNGADLSGANLSHANLSRASLHSANLISANLSSATLSNASLHSANLSGADLRCCFLIETNLGDAHLVSADLSGANLSGAHLVNANLTGANLSGACLVKANLSGANLSGANLSGANLSSANLSSVNLSCKANLNGAKLTFAYLLNANLSSANLSNADLNCASLIFSDLSEADLINTDLRRSVLVDTDFSKATITGCRIYGISAWNLNLKDSIQKDLIISYENEPVITVDDLLVAQFIYMLLNNENIRNVLNSITSKGVLILGRFANPHRKEILDGLRDKLRQFNLLPIVFDFDRPTDKDYTETVQTLVGISMFVIADLTSPKSTPLELEATIKQFKIPYVPIIDISVDHRPFAMLVDLQKSFHWVLPTLQYETKEDLLDDKNLKDYIIDPVNKKRNELRKAKNDEPEPILIRRRTDNSQ